MARTYGIHEWQEDLKRILGRAVVTLDQHVVLLFNDSEVNKYCEMFYSGETIIYYKNVYRLKWKRW